MQQAGYLPVQQADQNKETRQMKKHLVLALSFFLTACPVFASDLTPSQEHDTVTITAPWARASIGLAKNGAAFLTIENTGPVANRLVKVEAPEQAARAEIHQMSMQDGTMKMRPLANGLPLRVGETVTLKPGGNHIMLFGLKKPLIEGETFPLKLLFEKSKPVTTTVTVQSGGAMSCCTGK